jgi:hypothetical protein
MSISIELKGVRLINPYINKKLEANTLREVLKSTHHTAYRLYLIANGFKELQEFAAIKGDEYDLTAYIKTECGFIGAAKKQVWSVTELQPLLYKKPIFTLRCELRHLVKNEIVYKCTLEHRDASTIYDQIQECIFNLKQILE